jgi:asparagine synthase (glutamine-hydrolysing)
MVSKLAAGHVKMVLTGEGGDELFAGYARYVGEQYSRSCCRIPRAARSVLRNSIGIVPGLRRPKIAAYALSISDEAQRFTNWFPLCNDHQKARVLSNDCLAALNGHETTSVLADHLSRCDDSHALNRMLYTDTKLWLPDYLLLRGDKLTMAHSLEARVPLLDHKLVEFAASLPPKLKLRGRVRKYLLKRVASRFLPDTIVHRRKEGRCGSAAGPAT